MGRTAEPRRPACPSTSGERSALNLVSVGSRDPLGPCARRSASPQHVPQFRHFAEVTSTDAANRPWDKPDSRAVEALRHRRGLLRLNFPQRPQRSRSACRLSRVDVMAGAPRAMVVPPDGASSTGRPGRAGGPPPPPLDTPVVPPAVPEPQPARRVYTAARLRPVRRAASAGGSSRTSRSSSSVHAGASGFAMPSRVRMTRTASASCPSSRPPRRP